MLAQKSWRLLGLCALCIWCGSISAAFAQSEALTISVHKSVGYNNGSQIQGTFRIEASGPANLTSVTFKIDDTLVGAVTTPPFKINFSTDDYATGWHTFSATGQTAAGHTLTAPTKRFEFLTNEQAWKATQGLLIPIFAALGIALVIGFGSQFIFAFRGGKKASLPLGAARNYGISGGAICPKCQRPFARHLWGLNVGLWKFDRCEHCGKWSLVARATPQQLAEAETAELQMAQPEKPVAEPSPAEKLKQQIDESRFDANK
jgi:hypothetical protein